MDLSPEDSLRLNVLLNQDLQAIRIDDSKMIVYGLSERGEAQVPLNPNCQDEKYIKQVKELISTHVLGSPGGYPIFLRRWTRMGQARDESLESLLKLGEPEAVVAVVHAGGINDELARRAWWAMPSAENARCMLSHDTIVKGTMGRVLAEYLIDYLPFEEEPKDIIDSVRLVLQGDLIDEETRQGLWTRGQRKNAYLVGFLKTTPDHIPLDSIAHPHHLEIRQQLQSMVESNNSLANLMCRVLDAPGQSFLKTAATVMKKPVNQDVVIALLEAMRDYFAILEKKYDTPVDTKNKDLSGIEAIIEEADAEVNNGGYNEIETVLSGIEETRIRSMIKAMLVLSRIGEHVVTPIFSRSDAVGTVMRKKLEPVFTPIEAQLRSLLAGG